MIIISIHIFPQELSEYARVIESLNHSYDFVNLPNDFCLFVTLNDNKKLVHALDRIEISLSYATEEVVIDDVIIDRIID